MSTDFSIQHVRTRCSVHNIAVLCVLALIPFALERYVCIFDNLLAKDSNATPQGCTHEAGMYLLINRSVQCGWGSEKRKDLEYKQWRYSKWWL